MAPTASKAPRMVQRDRGHQRRDQRRTHQNVTFLDARRDRRDVGKSGGPRVAGRGLAGARGKLES